MTEVLATSSRINFGQPNSDTGANKSTSPTIHFYNMEQPSRWPTHSKKTTEKNVVHTPITSTIHTVNKVLYRGIIESTGIYTCVRALCSTPASTKKPDTHPFFADNGSKLGRKNTRLVVPSCNQHHTRVKTPQSYRRVAGRVRFGSVQF